MKKIKTLSGIEGFYYGLPSTTSSSSSQMSIKIHSVFGAYNEHDTTEGEEYIEETQNALEDVKPKVEDTAPDNTSGTNTRSQLFHDIESGDPSKDDHITLLTSHMSLKEDNSSAEHPSHQNPQVTPVLEETHNDTPATNDSMSELITIYDEAVKTDHTCDSEICL